NSEVVNPGQTRVKPGSTPGQTRDKPGLNMSGKLREGPSCRKFAGGARLCKVLIISEMAKQKGRILLDGRIGDMVFYNTRRYGMVAREIGKVPKKVREQGASFEKPRRNNTEFGY